MTEITSQELKQIALKVLCQIRDVCFEQKIRFFLDGGTLLGAVRHGGFIPWDDDIDICMPRPDYNKFIEYCKSNETPFGVVSHETDDRFMDLYAKAYDKNTFCKELYGNRFGASYGVYVDIFPIDGLGNNKDHALKLLHKTRFDRSLLTAANWQKYFRSKTRKWYIEPIRFVFYLLSRFGSPCRLIKKIETPYKNLSFETSEYVAVICGCYGDKEVMPRYIFDNSLTVMFENEPFPAMEKHSEFLTNLYGNYMELPPIEKRKSHHTFIAYKN